MPDVSSGAAARKPRVGVVIPARNEGPRLGEVLRAIPRTIGDVGDVVPIVVDDGSHDDTEAVARRAGARVIHHQINLGKGGALSTGCQAALGWGCDLIVLMDADGQHRPADLPRLVAPLVAGDADLVLARRRLSAEMPIVMRAGNWGLSLLFAILYGRRFGDTQCGLRAFTSAAEPRLRWVSTDYSVETEMLIRAVRGRLKVAEVEIDTVYHDSYKGTTLGDGLRIFGNMLRWMVRA
jgi:glycosyltransferase involved in cell wall biosynthesis